RRLEKEYAKLEKAATMEEAAAQLISAAAEELQVDAHVRLHDGVKLRLVGGRGSYYRAALAERKELSLDENSPSVRSFKGQEWIIFNNPAEHSEGRILPERFDVGPLRKA